MDNNKKNLQYTLPVIPIGSIKDQKESNTQEYFHHSNVKRYELAPLRPGYLKPFDCLVIIVRLAKADLDNIIDGDISTTHSIRLIEVPVDIKVKSLTDLKISLCENAESQPERY